MEHIVFSSIMTHIERYKLLSNFQHGFRKGLSCETKLLMTFREIAKQIDIRYQVDLIYLDFSKAFDRVPHKRLIAKLSGCGIDNKTILWIQAFLSDRIQRVVHNGDTSDIINVTSGVPQGSVLGPLLFLIYINDIALCLKSSIRLFADDCLLYKTVNNLNDVNIIQRDLEVITNWCEKWNMTLNVNKCAVVLTTLKRKMLSFLYKLCNENLTVLQSYKYLGVTITHDLQWNDHINKICGKASSILRLLQRNLSKSTDEVKIAAFMALVSPISMPIF